MLKKKEKFMWKNNYFSLTAFLLGAFFLVFSLGIISASVEGRFVNYDGSVLSSGVLFDRGDNSTNSYADGTKTNPNVYLRLCSSEKESLENKFVATFYSFGNESFVTSVSALKIYSSDIDENNCSTKDIDFSPSRAIYPGAKSFALCDNPNFPQSCLEDNMYEIAQEYGSFNGSFEFISRDVNGKGEINVTKMFDHEGNDVNMVSYSGTEIIIGLVNKTTGEIISTNTTTLGVPVNLSFNSVLDDFDIYINGLERGGMKPKPPVDPPRPSPGVGVPRPTVLPPVTLAYNVTPEEIYLESVQREVKSFILELENIGDGRIDFSFSTDLNFLRTPINFSLDANQKREVEFLVYSPEEIGIYRGNVIVNGSGVITEIPVVLEVKSGVLFDIVVEVLQEYKEVYAGEEVKARIELTNLGLGEVELLINYFVSDGIEEITSRSKTVSVETSHEFVAELFLPREIELGEYYFNALVRYDNITLAGYDNFHIVREPLPWYFWVLWVLLPLLIILLLVIIILVSMRKARRIEEEERRRMLIGRPPTEFVMELTPEQERKVEAMRQAEIRRNLILLDKLDFLAGHASYLLRKGNVGSAKRRYEKIIHLYNQLNNDSKKEFYYEGMRLYRALRKKRINVAPLDKPEDIVNYRDKRYAEELLRKLEERRRVERRRNLFWIKTLDSFVYNAYSSLSRKKNWSARRIYEKIRTIYSKKLKSEYQKEFYERGMKLYHALKGEGLKVFELEAPED